MTEVEKVMSLAKECLEHAESCYQAQAYNCAMEWVKRSEDYVSRLKIVTVN